MFNFSTLITLIVAVIVAYLPLYFNFKNDIDDFTETSFESEKNKNKIDNRKKKIKSLNIIYLILILAFIILYKIPSIIETFKSIDLTNIGNFFTGLLPFKKGFFENSNFKFSYITELILSIIIEIGLLCFIDAIFIPLEFYEYIIETICLIIVAYCLIWTSTYISTILSSSIISYFEAFSIIINIVIYIIIALIIFFIIFIIFSILLLANKSYLNKDDEQ